VGALLLLLIPLSRAAAHPGQSLGVSIEIRDDGVAEEILISADLMAKLVAERALANADPQKDHDASPQSTPDTSAPPTAEQIHAALIATFESENPVIIDGEPVAPVLKSTEFIDARMPGFPMDAPPDVHVRLLYPASEKPQQVELVWTVFPQDPTRKRYGMTVAGEVVVRFDACDESRIVVFTEAEPGYTWHAPPPGTMSSPTPVIAALEQPTLHLPVVSLGTVSLWLVLLGVTGFSRRVRRRRLSVIIASIALLGVAGLAHDTAVVRVASPWGRQVALPDAAEASDICRSLQTNVYDAFEKKAPSDIYDVLAYSVDGDLLDEVYNEVYQSLIMRDQGGAVARIKGIKILDVELDHAGVLAETDTAAFTVRSRWRVHGAVYHWGHVHSRTNEYTARITITKRDGSWKITKIDDLEGERIAGEEGDPRVSRRTPPGPTE
jgi:hypothetical protein